ncbi:TPA: sugar ABC transporter substrate-binding protein, partial [Streptococcus pyogenes]|nr:sugar ABC transporter substrate-binding protein [Streptococcus pyogenes]
MKSWQKVIVGGASLTLASTLLVGCGSGSKDKKEAGADSKTIKLWVPTGSKKSYADTIAKFEKDSGYTVKV